MAKFDEDDLGFILDIFELRKAKVMEILNYSHAMKSGYVKNGYLPDKARLHLQWAK